MAHLSTDNTALLARVRRLQGQLKAIERALAAGEECSTTLHLVAGVRGAVGGLMDEILQEHLRAHVAHPDLTDAERAEGAKALIDAMRRYAK
ncbi:metal/formaldehyde-sensitive transcriptional repressor [Reyranella aquatilis]|jgi:DNA-binding FrmR family transcriptional regulator|uniref:Metal/formaldehyde-sensitive transcriptional repressor n=1 Tax=Reyranella aquatilis TaxID=2035356 RepID=A0ABS8KNF9_9HYPH|nr:metal/formaldehyde-sensitive transcriptional repressor [Reyranella aquatilis]MCC8427590.1 metal/formaldehyde-sensitive transcriptional repressor [Reyranella aquatilis]